MGTDLSLSAAFLAWIPTMYLLIAGILYIPFGRLGDIYGRKKVILYGLIIFTVSSFFTTFSLSGDMFVVIRVFQSIGNAMVFANLFALISSVFPLKERGQALGIVSMGVFMGLVLGPIIGGVMGQLVGWRSLFFLDFLVGLICTILMFRFSGEWKESSGEKFDLKGSITLSLSLGLIIYGLSTLNSKFSIFLLIGGVIGLTIFYLQQKRTKVPLINLDIFNIKTFTFGSITAFLNYSGLVTVSFMLSLYLQYVKGFDPLITGIIIASQSIFMVVVSPVAGKISDNMDSWAVTTVGMILVTLGLAFLSLIRTDTSIIFIVIALSIFGIGEGFFYATNTKNVLSSVDKKYLGIANATLSDMRSLGQVFGMGFATLFITIIIGDVTISNSNYLGLITSLNYVFLVMAVLSAIGIFTSVIRDN
jgi:EmrB/QacA subfamily drug resistance transporter